MKRLTLIVLAVAALTGTAVTPVAAQPPARDSIRPGSDNIDSPLSIRQNALKQAALEAVLRGEAVPTGANQVVKIFHDKGVEFVELAFEGKDEILTLLGEFGNQKATHDHGTLGTISHGGANGPLHNQIPQPNRNVDNSTIWEPNFSRQYYDTLLYDRGEYPSMANWYLEQSSGQYTVDGYVSDWVKVPNDAAAYGSNYCGDIVCTRDIGRFIEDQADRWWTTLVAQRGSVANANEFLRRFDVWDRYDFDGDGNFDERDGYIDHFQSVHAGEGEETGGGAHGEDAIWSHRSYVNSIPIGSDGPSVGGNENLLGGARIGNSNFWIGDYTVEPENGGVGVFSHEYAHDLGLPDLYDTSGNTGGAENSTGFWTVMSSGSYGSQTNDIGSFPTHFGAWEKFQLGFLENYTVANYTQRGNYVLGPAEYNTNKPQAMFIVLPDKVVTRDVGNPYAGNWFYHSGWGNNIDHTMTREISLGSGPINMSFRSRYHIEGCWDYAYVQVSDDDGETWTNIETNRSSDENTNGQNFGNGITGVSGHPLECDNLDPNPQWVNVTANLNAYANQDILLRFRYWTDGAVVGEGFGIDNLQISGEPMDNAETDPGWEYDGFIRTGGDVTNSYFNAYVLESRQYIGYDYSLRHGPYNFTTDTFVERFPYQDGLLISYWDNSFDDNNVGDHPGGGLILPIDAHPQINVWSDDGSQARPRINSYDSTFTLTEAAPITLHNPATGEATTFGPRPAVRVFNDNLSYYRANHASDAPGNTRYQAGWNSVRVPHTGTKVRIVSLTASAIHLELNK